MPRHLVAKLLRQGARSVAESINTKQSCMQSSATQVARACGIHSMQWLPTQRGYASGNAQANSKQEQEAAAEAGAAEDGAASPEQEAAEEQPVDPKDAQIAKHEEEIASLKDRLIRTLADMENLRERSARQAENASKFAVQGFVKDFLEVPDTLERALTSVKTSLQKAQSEGGPGAPEGGPEGAQIVEAEIANLDRDQAVKLLLSLVQGIEMTDKIMMQIFAKNGVERMTEVLGAQFDPNLHNALFELPDPAKDPGTIAHVVKTGYTLHGRVVRPAHVGVVRAPDS